MSTIDEVCDFVERGQKAQLVANQIIEKANRDKKNLAFLKEMKAHFEAFRKGDPTEGEYVAEMIDDWIRELEPKA